MATKRSGSGKHTSGMRPGKGSLADGARRRPSASRGASRRTLVVGGIVAVLVVIAAVLAVALSSGGDDGVPAGVEQNRSVEIEGTSLPVLPDSGADPAIGTKAPTVVGAEFDGTPMTIKPGRPTLVVVVAHWCPHCRAEVPRLVAWYQAGQVPAGVDVVGVSTSVDSTKPNYPPSKWLSTEGFPWPVMADSKDQTAANALGLSAFPYFVMLGADGSVLWRTTGEVATADLTAKITASLTG